MSIQRLLSPLAILLLCLTALSCGTGNVVGPNENAAVLRSNLQPDSTIGWLYYSLEGDSVVPPSQSGTDAWDVRMAYLLCCGKTQQIDVFLNSGTAGTGSVKGALVASRFESIVSVPSSLTLKSDDTSATTRIIPVSLTDGLRLFTYDVTSHTIGVSPDVVLVLTTTKGSTFKFQFTSIYKDAPSKPDVLTPLGYYHFRYQQAVNGDW